MEKKSTLELLNYTSINVVDFEFCRKGAVKVRKPKGRKERVDFLIKKMAFAVIGSSLVSMTDREVKQFFEEVYPFYKNKEDYKNPEYKSPECLVCGDIAVAHWDCCCGHAIIYENDTALQELKDSGEFDEIRKRILTK